MLNIGATQMEAFQDAAKLAFEKEMLEHLRKFSPPLIQAVGDDQICVAIRFGIQQAEHYGFTFRGPVRLYLELMLLFGSFFDTDPQYTWAGHILAELDSITQMQRAERLYLAAVEYRETVIGPDDAYALQALKHIQQYAQWNGASRLGDFVPDVLRDMKQIYPQKTDFVGELALAKIIDKGIDTARRHKLGSERAVTLLIILMIAFGHGCVDDPLYPWINRTLKDENIIDSEARARRLEKKSQTWLTQVLSYFEGPQV